jgi:hypothetical protein
MHLVLGRVVVERQQLLLILGDLGGGLGELRPVGGGEGLDCLAGAVLVLGVPDLGQGLLRARVRGLRQRNGGANAAASWGPYQADA